MGNNKVTQFINIFYEWYRKTLKRVPKLSKDGYLAYELLYEWYLNPQNGSDLFWNNV